MTGVTSIRTLRALWTCDPAVSALPDPYADALRSALTGADQTDLAQVLAVPEETTRNVVRLAVAKFAALLDDD